MDLENLIKNNNIDEYEVKNIVLNMILLSVFEEIYNYLEKDNNKQILKNQLRKGESSYTIKQMINNHIYMNLGEKEYKFLIKLIIAYLRKKEKRQKYDKEEKKRLLFEQENKCNICKREINNKNSHVDHIIPFKMVGDELDENLQLLCEECNLNKSGSINFYLKTIVKRFVRP
ncbi:HNH endonuclease [Clostridium perfringens]|uniref:HNH endonuclease n=1 Tax=Clostridium perfringens TaxID=1502 RepID=A0A2X3E3Z1_CLOPF|nr:HNH endonuclease signature motif containing protein [Clostridium perfringens]SQC06499.1 HNH endonuclease [Clostridium perfringens]